MPQNPSKIAVADVVHQHNSAVPGFTELDGTPVHHASSSRAAGNSHGSGPSSNGFTPFCNTQIGQACDKPCCKSKPKANGRRVKVVTTSDGESTENNEPSIKGKKTAQKDKDTQTDSENESSAQIEDASTDASTSVLSSIACLKDPNWTLSEDCRLRSMKEAGESWDFIRQSLCKAKDDVRARWKVLQSQLRSSQHTTDTESGNAITDGESAEDTTDDGNKADDDTVEESEDEDDEDESDEDESSADEEEDESDDDEDEDDNDDEESDSDDEDEDEDDEDDDGSSEDLAEAKAPIKNKWHEGTRNGKIRMENKWAKARANLKTSKDLSSTEADDDAPGENSDSSSSLFCYGSKEKQEEMKYLQEHIYGAMYPPDIHLQPDAALGKRDCALLASLDSQHKRSRWLEMQANFYNVTGRMVPLEDIKARCEQAERSKTRGFERRLSRVELWVDEQKREAEKNNDSKREDSEEEDSEEEDSEEDSEESDE
ncbi:hypothetical protein IL306_005952 [Fusarium sp. DS 682]|nr:hypothetical protein IL306_005952 [Fusarium sp. DS 682]